MMMLLLLLFNMMLLLLTASKVNHTSTLSSDGKARSNFKYVASWAIIDKIIPANIFPHYLQSLKTTIGLTTSILFILPKRLL